MFDWISHPDGWIALLTLSVLEVVLGIDNVVFVSILTGRLPQERQAQGMRCGLILAIIPRVLLLLTIGLVMRLNQPLFHLPVPETDPEALRRGSTQLGITGQDLVFLLGGLFLIYKSVKEIHLKLEGCEDEVQPQSHAGSFVQVMSMVFVVNIVFSLDSVITAVGMVEPTRVGGSSAAIAIMILAVLVSTLMMLGFATPVAHFVERHPTVKVLALSFLILIGINLLAEGLHQHIPKGYTYFAMAFALGVEMLNLRVRRSEPVMLHEARLSKPD